MGRQRANREVTPTAPTEKTIWDLWHEDKQSAVTKTVKDFGEGKKPSEYEENVFAELKKASIEFSESTVKQYVAKARASLGWVRARATGGEGSPKKAPTSAEPTLSDQMTALDLVATLGTSPADLLKLVGELKSAGDLNTLETCLESIVRIQALGKGK